MNHEQIETLTPTGSSRKDAMLAELTAVMQRTHHTRRRRRRVLFASVVLLGLVNLARLGLVAAPRPEKIPIMAHHERPIPTPIPVPERDMQPACALVLVKSDPGVLERFRVNPSGRVIILDDRALLDSLMAINRPSGLIRYASHVRLSAAVTDADLRLKQ